MIYLISQLGLWLLLTAAFAAIAGWAFAAERAVPDALARERSREGLLRDLSKLASGDVAVDSVAAERESESMRRLLEVRDGRITELETLLSAARARADEAASRVAELERAPAPSAVENEELARLRALTSQYESERAREVEIEAAPVEADQDAVLQAWRLRYFEQRVRYLESKAAEPSPHLTAEPVVEPTPDLTALEWRAREAEARAAHLADEVRALSVPPASVDLPQVEAFAANAEIDMMLRWRMLYLERRAAYLQEEVARAPAPAPVVQGDPDTDRWKWRARFLEARVRHLEQQPVPVAALSAPAPAETVPAPAPVRQKPDVLPAPRQGAPDDFTLIEDVSVLQQTTLYSLGVFHFDQIAAWSPANVAWVDHYLRLRGRIDGEEWVEQAQALARDGVGASRRVLADAEA